MFDKSVIFYARDLREKYPIGKLINKTFLNTNNVVCNRPRWYNQYIYIYIQPLCMYVFMRPPVVK